MRRHSSYLALILLAASSLSLRAQQDDSAVFTSDTRLVVLHATVVDKNGKHVTNLPKNAFHVYEDGLEQQMKVFRREDVPVSMGIIIDNSGSMRDKRRRVESASLTMVKASNPEDQVFVVNFNDDAFLDVPFTNNIKKLEDGVARIDSRGGTAMRDAVSMSIDYLKQEGKKDKKVLVVITDGNDNSESPMTLEKLVQKAQQSEVLIYSIGLLTEEERREAKRAKRALDVLTKATGGQAYYPKEAEEVEKTTLQVAHDIRNQYIIAYSPTKQELDGSFRQIKVTVNAGNRPQVRTRTGYYATRGEAAPAATPSAQAAGPATAVKP